MSITTEQKQEIEKSTERAWDVMRRYSDKADDGGELLTDLLTDLMHWADCYAEDFDRALRYAQRHYQAEIRGEP